MHTVNIHKAKTKLPSLVEKAVEGEEVVITKAGSLSSSLFRSIEISAPDLREDLRGRFPLLKISCTHLRKFRVIRKKVERLLSGHRTEKMRLPYFITPPNLPLHPKGTLP